MKTNNSNKIFTQLFAQWTPKVFALLVAIAIFLAVEYFGIADRRVTIPLSVDLPTSTAIEAESLVPDHIDIVISGDDALVYLVDPDSIIAHADFSRISSTGIARVPVELKYNQDVFKSGKIVVSSSPSVVRILFKAKEAQ